MVNKDKVLFTPTEVMQVLLSEVTGNKTLAIIERDNSRDEKVQERYAQAIVFFEQRLIPSLEALRKQIPNDERDKATITAAEFLFGLMQLLEIICHEATIEKRMREEGYLVNPQVVVTFFTALRVMLKL